MGIAFGANFDGQCNVPPLGSGAARYVAPAAMSYLVVTLTLRHQDPNRHIIACVSMSGTDIAVIAVDLETTLLSGVRVALAKRLKMPLWRLRFILADARLLTESDDSRCVGEPFGCTPVARKSGAMLCPAPLDLDLSNPPTPIAVTAR